MLHQEESHVVQNVLERLVLKILNVAPEIALKESVGALCVTHPNCFPSRHYLNNVFF